MKHTHTSTLKARAVFYGLGDYEMALAARLGHTLGSEDEYSGDELEFSEDGDDLSHDEGTSGDDDSEGYEGRGCESEAESTEEGSEGGSEGSVSSDEESDADEDSGGDSSEQGEGSGEPNAAGQPVRLRNTPTPPF